MRKFWLQACCWSGAVGVTIIGLGMWMSGFIPLPSPSDSADDIKDLIMSNLFLFRLGMIVAMLGSGLLVAYAAALFVHMKRIEGEYSVLSLLQFGSGALFSLEFIYIIFFWQTASFRPERSAEAILLLNDMGWIPFVGITCSAMLQAASIGIVMLMDEQPQPNFPRWLGFFNIFCCFAFLPGAFNVYFKTGPFAWNGLIALYLPATIYGLWNFLNSYYMSKATGRMDFTQR
jgi:hypothetical protein